MVRINWMNLYGKPGLFKLVKLNVNAASLSFLFKLASLFDVLCGWKLTRERGVIYLLLIDTFESSSLIC